MIPKSAFGCRGLYIIQDNSKRIQAKTNTKLQIESLQASLKMQASILQTTSDLIQMHYSNYMACEQDQRQAISGLESKLSKAEKKSQKLTAGFNVVNQAHDVSKKENMQALQQISTLEPKIANAEKTCGKMSSDISKLESELEKPHEIRNQNQNEITCKIKAFDRVRREKDCL